MSTSPREKELLAENERLRKQIALQRELIEVLRELPGNRGRGIETVTPEGSATEAGAAKPRKRKSRGRGALPEDPGVVSPPSS